MVLFMVQSSVSKITIRSLVDGFGNSQPVDSVFSSWLSHEVVH